MIEKWKPELVRDYFDENPNVSLHELGAYSGHTRSNLKRILMTPQKETS